MNLLKTQQDSEPEQALETAMAMVASALSDPSRVSILCALMDGRAWTATELSTVAEVSASSTPVTLRYARTCYDHLAGELAVKIYEFMLREKWLAADGQSLTSAGKIQLESLGAVLNARPRRKPCCPCLDWSERRFHLGGDAGSALMALFEQKGWITRAPGYREVQVTDSGRAALARLFNLKVGG